MKNMVRVGICDMKGGDSPKNNCQGSSLNEKKEHIAFNMPSFCSLFSDPEIVGFYIIASSSMLGTPVLCSLVYTQTPPSFSS